MRWKVDQICIARCLKRESICAPALPLSNFQSPKPIINSLCLSTVGYLCLLILFHFPFPGRFIYSFMGVGILLCCITFLGCIAAEAFNVCCLCFVSHLWKYLSAQFSFADNGFTFCSERSFEWNLWISYFQLFYLLSQLIPWPSQMLVHDTRHRTHSTRGCSGGIHCNWPSMGKGSFFLLSDINMVALTVLNIANSFLYRIFLLIQLVNLRASGLLLKIIEIYVNGLALLCS